MKKALCAFLVFALLLPTATAWRLEHTDIYYNTAPHVEGANNNVDDMAKMLYDLGLLKGRGEGDFALQSPMTREEAAVMLVRFLGGEDEALTGKFTHPFSDVAGWADPYVGWLYQKKLTKGVGNGKYGTGNVTMWQYSTFLSRAVYGNEDNGMATEAEIAQSEATSTFLREAAVSLSVRALTAYYWRDTTYGNLTTAGWLCRQGVFTEEQFNQASLHVLPSVLMDENGTLYRKTALVTVATCPKPGLTPISESLKIDGDYVFAYEIRQEDATLYELDYSTMSVNGSDSIPAKQNLLHLEYVASAEGLDYFVEHLAASDWGTRCGDLLVWDGETFSVAKTAEELWKGSYVYPSEYGLLREDNLVKGESLGSTEAVLCTESALLTLGKELRQIPIPVGSKVLGWDGKVVALQCVTAENTTIFAVNVETGETVDSYTVLHDGEGEAYRRTVWEQFAPGHGYYHGEAGLYRLLDGRLLQLTDMPAPVVTARRTGAVSMLVILSHDLGKRCYAAMTAPGLTGDKIYMEDGLGGFTLYFEVKPEWELNLDTIFCASSTICLRSAQSVGMQHFDSYTYAILPDGDTLKLHVMDYEAGRPEMMTKTKLEYIWDEMDRLHALGISDPGPSQEDRANILAESAKQS